MTLAATNAAAFATNDRAAGLDWPLPVTTAAIALNTATIRADRVLGDTTATEVRQRGEGK